MYPSRQGGVIVRVQVVPREAYPSIHRSCQQMLLFIVLNGSPGVWSVQESIISARQLLARVLPPLLLVQQELPEVQVPKHRPDEPIPMTAVPS